MSVYEFNHTGNKKRSRMKSTADEHEERECVNTDRERESVFQHLENEGEVML
jgi:hypothetical protein